MVDREKVIKGLAACMPQNENEASIVCDGCPYNGNPCGGDYQDNDHVNLPVALIEDIRALLKAQEPKGKAYWIQRVGRGHGWNCSNCGEKISYNEEQKTRQKRVLPVWLVNKYCRGCGYEMTYPPENE